MGQNAQFRQRRRGTLARHPIQQRSYAEVADMAGEHAWLSGGDDGDVELPTIRFTPDPFEEFDLDDIPESLRASVEAAQRLSERSLAPATLNSYGSAWKRWAKWCMSHGFDPLAHDPKHLMVWLSEMVTNHENPNAPGRVRPVSLGPIVAAIDRAAKARGQAPPSHDRRVKSVLGGIRRQYGMAPTRQRAALEADLLCDLADHLSAPTHLAARDAVVVALRGAGLSLGECSGREANGIGWQHITFSANSATVQVPSKRGNRSRSVELTGADLDWLRQLNETHSTENGPVLDLSRQGVNGSARRSITAAGLGADADLTRASVRNRIYARLAEPTNAQVRDMALLCIGWFSALRRSNLHLLRWEHVTPAEDGLELYIPYSKTDQEGHGATIFIPAAHDSGLPCPVTALRMYADRLRSATGVEPVGNEPVFVPVDRHDNFTRNTDDDGSDLAAMSGWAINDAVRRMVEQVGIDPTRYGSHSLRAGFITSAFDAGVSAADIADTTKQTLDVLMGYNRPNDRRRRSAAAQMHRASSDKPTASVEEEPEPQRPPDGPPAAFMP